MGADVRFSNRPVGVKRFRTIQHCRVDIAHGHFHVFDLLSGILFDACGERMSPTHATKNNTRYRYYISRSLLVGTVKHSGQRIPASRLEALVIGRIHNWLSDRAAILDTIQRYASDATTQKRLMSP